MITYQPFLQNVAAKYDKYDSTGMMVVCVNCELTERVHTKTRKVGAKSFKKEIKKIVGSSLQALVY